MLATNELHAHPSLSNQKVSDYHFGTKLNILIEKHIEYFEYLSLNVYLGQLGQIGAKITCKYIYILDKNFSN